VNRPGAVQLTVSGWLLSLNMQSLNDCCDREQTMKNITGRFLGRKI